MIWRLGWRDSFLLLRKADWILAGFAFLFFYFHRAQHFSGDGALIARMTEGGKWLVQNELLSQVFLQLLYRLMAPFHNSAMDVMNLAACVGGVLSLWILLLYAKLFTVSRRWTLLLFFSTGFFLYGCGHTEYYPLVLPAMLLYGFYSVLYLRDRKRMTSVAISFVAACGLHFAMLFALPSLILLPWIKGRKQDWGSAAIWLVLLIPLGLIRNYPQILGHKAASLSPAFNFLPWFPYEGMYRYYAVFQWGHWADWLYAWAMRSWILWPTLMIAIGSLGWRSVFCGERFFLLIYTIGFSVWTMLWHPDLGVEADWDLFAIEAAPCLLLTISIFMEIERIRFLRILMIIACVSSILVNYAQIRERLDLPRKGYGAISLAASSPGESVFTVDGYNRNYNIPSLREGVYPCRFIDRANRRACEFYVVVKPDRTTLVKIE